MFDLQFDVLIPVYTVKLLMRLSFLVIGWRYVHLMQEKKSHAQNNSQEKEKHKLFVSSSEKDSTLGMEQFHPCLFF